MNWEDAILNVFDKHGGIVTLNILYFEVPEFIKETKANDIPHNIRAYLRRLKKQKKLIKQIGLAQYALIDVHYENHFYEEINEKTQFYDFLKKIPKELIHTYIEGMLVELGNFKNFQTYTADKHKIFNGKYLEDLTAYKVIPPFTYQKSIEDIREIDVIWFQNGFPIKTFDVENSTRFSMALQRIYELRYFKTKFYMVANELKYDDFVRKSDKSIFSDIKESTSFFSYHQLFEQYKHAVIYNKAMKKHGLF